MGTIIIKKQILGLVLLALTMLAFMPLLSKTTIIPVSWSEIQPKETELSFYNLDAKVKAATANGDLILLQFESSPMWLYKNIPNITAEEVLRAKPPTAAYATFVEHVAKRYKGTVEGYLLWKIPSSNNLLATDTEIYTMFAAGIKAIQGVGAKAIIPEPGNANIVWIYNYFIKQNVQPNGIFLYPTEMQSTDEFGLRLYNLYAKIIKNKKIDIYADFRFISDDLKREYMNIVDVNQLDVVLLEENETPLPISSDIIYIDQKMIPTFAKYLPSITPDKAESNFGPDYEAGKITPLKNFPSGAYLFINSSVLGKILITRPNGRDQSKNNPYIYFDVPNDFIFFNTDGEKLKITLTVLGSPNENSDGFNLYYDSMSGMKNSPGWTWVEKGRSEKFSYSIILDDAAFASGYGYDFRINTGTSPSPLYLTDVTITKLNADGTEKVTIPIEPTIDAEAIDPADEEVAEPTDAETE